MINQIHGFLSYLNEIGILSWGGLNKVKEGLREQEGDKSLQDQLVIRIANYLSHLSQNDYYEISSQLLQHYKLELGSNYFLHTPHSSSSRQSIPSQMSCLSKNVFDMPSEMHPSINNGFVHKRKTLDEGLKKLFTCMRKRICKSALLRIKQNAVTKRPSLSQYNAQLKKGSKNSFFDEVKSTSRDNSADKKERSRVLQPIERDHNGGVRQPNFDKQPLEKLPLLERLKLLNTEYTHAVKTRNISKINMDNLEKDLLQNEQALNLQQVMKENEKVYSFTPQINKESTYYSRIKSRDMPDPFERLYRDGVQHTQTKSQILNNIKETLELKDCTFHPKISTSRKSSVSKSPLSYVSLRSKSPRLIGQNYPTSRSPLPLLRDSARSKSPQPSQQGQLGFSRSSIKQNPLKSYESQGRTLENTLTEAESKRKTGYLNPFHDEENSGLECIVSKEQLIQKYHKHQRDYQNYDLSFLQSVNTERNKQTDITDILY